MNSGLYAAPGDCATARAAETASRFAAPTTNVSKRKRGSSDIRSAPRLGRRCQPLEDQLRNAAQRLEDANAVQGVGGEVRNTAEVQRLIKVIDRHDHVAWEILLVVLKHERNGARIHPVIGEIRVQVLQALDVLLKLPRLAVGDEHHSIGSLKNELARRLVVDLARNRVELQSRGEAGDAAEIQREEIEKERAIGLRRERHHLPFPLVRDLTVDVVQVGRLPRPPGPVVDDLARNLARGVVDERHDGQDVGVVLRRPGARPNSIARLRFSSTSKFSSSIGEESGTCTFDCERAVRSSSQYSCTSPSELWSSNTASNRHGPRGDVTSARYNRRFAPACETSRKAFPSSVRPSSPTVA